MLRQNNEDRQCERACGAGLCFGAGLGITLFGMSYMFIHDGLVHRRFPVGPIDVPYLKRVAIAHKLHHSEKYDGVPWGLFLGPQARSCTWNS
jgi:beta-carotene 3-hydroxylase